MARPEISLNEARLENSSTIIVDEIITRNSGQVLMAKTDDAPQDV